jgi:uncharacterized protein
MTSLFLDAGFIIAVAAPRDERHSQAIGCWRGILGSDAAVTTTSFIVDEVVTWLNGKDAHAAAVAIGRILIESSRVDLVHVNQELFDKGWAYFVRHDDKRYSLTDCISFVLMEQKGLRQVLTFDRHFQQAGFECLP